jgi:hypothetical protein
MSGIDDIEKRVKDLSPDELASFGKWFPEFDNDLRDRQIESDATAGRLDALADEALRQHQNGETF